MKLADHVARIGERIGAYRILVKKWRERDYLENINVSGRIILK